MANECENSTGAEDVFSQDEDAASDSSDANVSFSMGQNLPVDDAVGRIVDSYDIGAKLRRLRLRRKVSLTDLGKHTGLSASMLSQLENGKLTPTLPTLARIAMVFDVSLEHFFSERKRQKLFAIVRGSQRMHFPERPDKKLPAYFFECLAFSAPEKSMQAYVAEFPPRAPEQVEPHFHEGSEFLYVIEGAIEIFFQGEAHNLRADDSVYFDASEPHTYRGTGKSAARAVVVTMLPRL